MTVGAFELTNGGLLGHQDGSIDVEDGAFYAILTMSAGGAPDFAADSTYLDIKAQESGVFGGAQPDYDQQTSPLVVTEAVVGPPNVIQVTIDLPSAEIDFGPAPVTITGRYFWILQGVAATPNDADQTLGVMDLNFDGADDVNSIASDFKVRANATNGLYRTTKA